MTRSTNARSQGDRGVERTSVIPMAFTSLRNSVPKMPSRSRRRYRGTWSKGNFPQLLGSPFGGGMGGDVEVDDAAPVMSQHQKYVQHLEADRGHREEVHRDHGLDVILQEGFPGL